MVGEHADTWHFFALRCDDLPAHWQHRTEDDHGHLFSFFWHPLARDLDQRWHPQFHDVLEICRRALPVDGG